MGLHLISHDLLLIVLNLECQLDRNLKIEIAGIFKDNSHVLSNLHSQLVFYIYGPKSSTEKSVSHNYSQLRLK